VRGGDGHLEVAREQQPDADGADHTEIAIHEDGAVHVGLGVAARIRNAGTDGLGDAATSQHGAGELEDHGERASLLDGQRLGAHRGGVRVGDVVGADAEGGEDGGDRAEDDDPRVSGRSGARAR